MIAEYKMGHKDELGISFEKLFELCNEMMLCHKYEELHYYLREAIDHNIVSETDAWESNIRYLWVNHENEVLEKILSFEW